MTIGLPGRYFHSPPAGSPPPDCAPPSANPVGRLSWRRGRQRVSEGLGGGRSDTFQAGVYALHSVRDPDLKFRDRLDHTHFHSGKGDLIASMQGVY
jgi:hypothetical protein